MNMNIYVIVPHYPNEGYDAPVWAHFSKEKALATASRMQVEADKVGACVSWIVKTLIIEGENDAAPAQESST